MATVRVIVVDDVCVPEVPVIVRGYWPVAAVPLAVNVMVLLEVLGFGANDAVTPEGSTETEKVTVPLNPYCGFTFT